jgi:transposase
VLALSKNREALRSAKVFRAIATRFEKTQANFLAAIHRAAAVIWLSC